MMVNWRGKKLEGWMVDGMEVRRAFAVWPEGPKFLSPGQAPRERCVALGQAPILEEALKVRDRYSISRVT